MSRLTRLLPLTALACAAAATPVVATPGALTPVNGPTNSLIRSLTATTNTQGDAVGMWSGQNNGPTVTATWRRSSGAIDNQVLSTEANAEDPAVSTDTAGGLVSAWSLATGGERPQYALAPAGASLFLLPGVDPAPPAQQVDTTGRFIASAGARGGEMVIVWDTYSGANHRVGVTRTAPGGGSVQATEFLTTTSASTADRLSAAGNRSGHLAAAWRRNSAIEVARAAPGAPFGGSPATVSLDPSASGAPSVGVRGDGGTLVYWRHNTADVRIAQAPPGGSFTTQTVPNSNTSTTQVVRLSDDRLALVSVEYVNPNWTAYVRFVSLTGAFTPALASPAIPITSGVSITNLGRAVATPDGGLVVPFIAADGVSVWLAGVSADGTPLGTNLVATGIASPNQTAAAPLGAGEAVVYWSQNPSSPYQLKVGGWDSGAAPRTRSLNVPATATVGAPVSVSALGQDVSGVTYEWNFGNGQTAVGATASVVFAAPGTYTVTLTMTDGRGNSRAETRQVQVTTPPPGGGAGGGTDTTDRTAPLLRLVAPTVVARGAFRRGPLVRLTSNEKATAVLTLRRGTRTLMTKRVAVAANTAKTLRLKLTPSARRRVVAGIRLTLTVSVTDAAGNQRTVRRLIRIR